MSQKMITRSRVMDSIADLPAFPQLVHKLLATIDDPDANLQAVAELVEADPVLTARVLAHAIRVGNAGNRQNTVSNVASAIFLLGLARVREIALTSRLQEFVSVFKQGNASDNFWHHSVMVAASGAELAECAPMDISWDASLIACLLHDVGQLWLQQYEPALLLQAQHEVVQRGENITVAEQSLFGVDHATVGGWLIESWGLPSAIAEAVTHHHEPDSALAEPLVCVTHVAEVLGTALSARGLTTHRVTRISADACARLGLDWGPETQQLFGRIEARSHHALRFLVPAAFS